MRAGNTARGLALAAWLLTIAWLVLLVTDRSTAGGWCLLGAGALLLVAGPLLRRDAQLRVTGAVMLGTGVFFIALGLIYAF